MRILILLALFFHTSTYASEKCIDLMIRPDVKNLKAKLSPDGLRIEKFDPSTIKKLLVERAKILKAYEALNRTVLASENYNFAIMAAQIAGYHTYIYGGPGAGKTLMPHTLNPNIWYKLVTEQTPPLALFGGQTLKGAEQGKEDINYTDSLITAQFANVDEVDKAQPQLLAEFLPILNTGERRISINGQAIRVATRSVHFTSNLNLYQMIERFVANGMDGTGLAFLNRIQIKMRVPNWLESHLMDQMIAQKKEVDRLKALALISPAAVTALKKLEVPSDIDWPFLEWAAETMFTTASDTDTIYRELADGFSHDIKQKLKMNDDASAEEARYSPTAEVTTRLVNEIPKFIRTTALLDLLLSDIPENHFTKLVEAPIVLSPLSTWRTFWMLTSVGPGRTLYNPKTHEVDFSMVPGQDGKLTPLTSDYLARISRDRLELQEVSNISDEQSKWASRLSSILQSYIDANKAVAMLLPDDEDSDGDFENVDFEHIIFKHRRK